MNEKPAMIKCLLVPTKKPSGKMIPTSKRHTGLKKVQRKGNDDQLQAHIDVAWMNVGAKTGQSDGANGGNSRGRPCPQKRER